MKKLSTALQKSWWSDKPWVLLLPFSWLFGMILRVRRWLYQQSVFKSEKLPVCTIVIGNLVVGGVGKTPLTIFLATLLAQMGKKPGIVSRGYGGSYRGIVEVYADGDPLYCGDEAVLLKRRLNCPVFVCKKRVMAGKALLNHYPDCDVIICDDGLQHNALKADIRIAVFDNRGAGNSHLLPAGPLREPVCRLSSVDTIVVNASTIPPALCQFKTPVFQMRLNADDFRSVSNPTQTAPLDSFAHQTVMAVAGIGNPQRFYDTLSSLQIDYIAKSFEDHHRFTPEDFPKTDKVILMTEKDSVKCMTFSQPNWYFLAVSAKLPILFNIWCAMKTGNLDCLVCPLCKGKLDYNPTEQTLTCGFDRLIYPIKDGIPIMLASDAIPMDETEPSND